MHCLSVSQIRYDVELKDGSVFKWGDIKFECVYYKLKNQYTIQTVDEFDQQSWIRFENVDPQPPLQAGDILLYGEDNWWCCYGANRIVSMLKYGRLHINCDQDSKHFQFLIG